MRLAQGPRIKSEVGQKALSHEGRGDVVARQVKSDRMRFARLCCSRLFGVLRHGVDRLQDPRSDLVGVPLRVRATIFQVALVVVLDEAVRHADRSAAVGHALGEIVDGLGLVQAGQAQVVVRAVDGDVLVLGGFSNASIRAWK